MMIGGEDGHGQASRSDFRDAGSRPGRHTAHAGTRNSWTAPPNRVICTAARTARAISSRWSTTASSTASWPRMPKGLASCASANVGKQQTHHRCGDHAAARSGTLSVRSQPARHHGGVAARQRDRLLAARPDGGQPGERSRSLRIRGARLGFRRRPLDDQGGHR